MTTKAMRILDALFAGDGNRFAMKLFPAARPFRIRTAADEERIQAAEAKRLRRRARPGGSSS
jgi:hypothetical protein